MNLPVHLLLYDNAICVLNVLVMAVSMVVWELVQETLKVIGFRI